MKINFVPLPTIDPGQSVWSAVTPAYRIRGSTPDPIPKPDESATVSPPPTFLDDNELINDIW